MLAVGSSQQKLVLLLFFVFSYLLLRPVGLNVRAARPRMYHYFHLL